MDIEIHPETPPGGQPLADRFPGRDLSAMYAALRQRAAEYGLEVGEVTRLSNSRLANAAAEFARDQGRHREFSREVFAAYFARSEDIGDMDVLAAAATACGLDAEELRRALAEDRYADRLDEHAAAAAREGISAVPTFIIGGSGTGGGIDRIVGAQPLESFRRVLRAHAG